MKILGYIPARGGSKGLPGKNLKPLAGAPLIAHTIRAARRSGCLDRLHVSTDDPRIAAAARRYGAPAPWLRPASLSRDASGVADAVIYDLDRLEREEGYRPDAVMLLQPTSPFRRPETLRRAASIFRRTGRSVISVTPCRNHPYWCFTVSPAGDLRRLFLGPGTLVARQRLPPAYALDGSVFLASVASLRRRRSFHGGRTAPVVVPPEEALDIDTPFDYALARAMTGVRRTR